MFGKDMTNGCFLCCFSGSIIETESKYKTLKYAKPHPCKITLHCVALLKTEFQYKAVKIIAPKGPFTFF